MKLEDPLARITKQQVATLCELAGFPTPEAVKGFDETERFTLYALRFRANAGVGPHVLRLDLVPHSRGAAIDHVLAAANSLQLAEDVPCRTDGVRVADRVFGGPAALYPWQELAPGLRLVSMNNRFWKTLAHDLGTVLAGLADHPVPSFGLRASNGRFLPSRSTWREEWMAYVHGLHAGSKNMGLDFGPLSVRALEAIQARSSSLDAVRQFCLVHGELKMNSLEYAVQDGVPHLAQLAGLDVSMLGDHLVEVGYLLTMPPSVLGPILAAYGPERVRDWLEPETLARIELYHLTLCLTRPSYVGSRILRRGTTGQIAALEMTRFMLEQALTPGFARQRLEAALEHAEAEAVPEPGPKPHRARTTLRRGIAMLRGDAPLEPALAPLVVAALGASALAVDLNDEAPYAQSLEEVGKQLLGTQNRLGVSLAVQPIDDRKAWATALLSDLVTAASRAQRTHGCSALMLAWLGLSSAERLGWTLSDSVLRGLEVSVRELSIQDQRDPPTDDTLLLQHAVTGRAAVEWMRAEGGVAGAALDELSMRLDNVIEAVVERSLPGVPKPVDRFEDTTLLPWLIDAQAAPEQRLMRPLLVLALRTLHRRVTLPIDASSLLPLMGG